jgi:hypothetical protein
MSSLKKSPRRIIFDTCREYASNTTAHGFSYIAEEGRSVGGRIFWSIIVIMAVAFTTIQMTILYNDWQNDPVITTLDTVSLPIEQIKFPAITICPQGSVKTILDSVLFEQLKGYIKNKNITKGDRQKRSASSKDLSNAGKTDFFQLTYDEMIFEAKEFLKDVYPGAKEKPTKLVSLMSSRDPQKVIESEAVLHPDKEKMCDRESDSETLETLNKQLNNDFCPKDFEMFGKSGCIHSSDIQMTYSDAKDYCTDHASSQLLYFETLEEVQLLNANNILGKSIYHVVSGRLGSNNM